MPNVKSIRTLGNILLFSFVINKNTNKKKPSLTILHHVFTNRVIKICMLIYGSKNQRERKRNKKAVNTYKVLVLGSWLGWQRMELKLKATLTISVIFILKN